MSQKLFYNTLKPQEQTVDQAAVTPSPMDLVWDLFSALSSSWNDQPPSFESGRFQVLPFHAESFVAEAHIQNEFLPRFDFAERHIEQLASTDSFSIALHMLHVLSLMERGIEKWKERHQFEEISTPKAVHVLYSKLFQKAEPPKRLLPAAPAKWSFTLLGNPSKTNCFFNVAIQTLFSNIELATSIVFSPHQFPEVKFAFLQYQEAAALRVKDPLDLATTLRMLYSCFKEEGYHDASEALVKMIEPVERDRAPFCSLTRITTYAGYESHIDQLEGFYPDGSRIEETQEAVYTLEVPDQWCVTLEEALFHAFNEDVTDPTLIEFTPTDGSKAVFLPRTRVQTRYTSAPKFLIFNLSLGDINLQAMTPGKKVTLVGLQRTFYLPAELTMDGQGAKYRLVSFNVHQGQGATQGHYVHYRETTKGFFAISDDVSIKISEIEYLLAAQTAYTVVLEKEDQPISKEALYQGYQDNQRRLSAMILTFQAINALNGATLESIPDQVAVLPYLTQFIESVIQGEPSLDAFNELPLSLQNLLLNLWSTSGHMTQLFDELDEQVEHPLSIPKIYSEEVFSGSYDLVPLMVDRLAKYLHKHPEQATTLQSHYELIIRSFGQISEKRMTVLKRRARMVNALFREVGQLALTCGVTALKLSSWDKKPVTIETLRKEGTITLQALSFFARLFFTRVDPLGESPTLQYGQQLITPALAMAKHHHDQGTWNFTPLISSAFNLVLSFSPLSESKKALTANFAPLVITDVLIPSYQSASTNTQLASLALSHLLHPHGRENVASRLSALYGFVAQLATHRLEQHTDLDHIQTSPQGWAARTLQILATNSALQSLVTETVAQRLRPTRPLPSLSPQERKAIRDQKYEELKQALREDDRERAQFHVDEIVHLEQQLTVAGIDLKTNPLQLQHLIDTHEQYATQATRFNSLIDERDQALATKDHETAERLEQELEPLFTALEDLRKELGLPSEKPAQDHHADDEQQTQIEKEERLVREKAETEKQRAIEEEQKKADEQYAKEMVEYNRKVAYAQAVNDAVKTIKQCQRAVRRREYRLEERLEKLHKQKHKKSQYDKAVKQVKKYNRELGELDQAINHYNALTGNPERISTPKMKKPQRPSWDDRLASRLEAIGFESINVSVSAPLYPTRTPQLTDRQPSYDAPPPPKPAEPTKPQPRKPALETATPTINTTFQDVQALQRQELFETNMAFKSHTAEPQTTSLIPPASDTLSPVSMSFAPTPTPLTIRDGNLLPRTPFKIEAQPLS